MLPAEITTEAAQAACEEVSEEQDVLLDRIDDAGMTEFLEEIAERLRVQHNLTDEQADELVERLCWKVHLLPPPL